MPRIDVQALVASAIEKGSEVEVIEKLIGLQRELKKDNAREAWYAAMARFQATCPPIRKTKGADFMGTGGRVKYDYAPLDEIMSVINPVMGPLGLSVSWKQRFEGKHLVLNCLVAHELGHVEESGEFPVPMDAFDKTSANPAQRIGMAQSYGRRYTLLSIGGLAPEDDTDALTGDEAAAEAMPQSKDGKASKAAQNNAPERIVVECAVQAVTLRKPSDPKKSEFYICKFVLRDSEGTELELTTFDKKLAEVVRAFAGTGETVKAEYEIAGAYKNLRGISAANEPTE